MAATSVPLSERFWAKVDTSDGCWLWTRGVNNKGYGEIKGDSRRWLVHRLSWTMANGPIPDGLWVLHHCDTPNCVRPSHLFLGNHAANMADMGAKGRARSSKVTHCPVGHEYTPENTWTEPSTGRRRCRACRPIKRRERKDRMGYWQ